MGPVEITSIAAVIVTVLTSLVVPYWLRRRQEQQAGDATGLQSWQSVTAVLQRERDELKAQIAHAEQDCRDRVKALDEDYTRQLTAARTRIGHLETEVATLYEKLGRQAGGSKGMPPGPP